MKVVILIEKTDGSIGYKCDTFWSRSSDIISAKLHDGDPDNIERLVMNFKYNLERFFEKNIELYNSFKDSKCGYREINKDDTDGYSINKEVKLNEIVYTRLIKLTDDGKVDFLDMKPIIREQKLNDLL